MRCSLVSGQSRQVGDYLLDFIRVRPAGQAAFLRPAHSGGGYHLHGAGDFGRALHPTYAPVYGTNIGQSLPLRTARLYGVP